jgi:hypothetical protein
MIFACANWLDPKMKIHFGVHKNKQICNVFFGYFFLLMAWSRNKKPFWGVLKTRSFVSFLGALEVILRDFR